MNHKIKTRAKNSLSHVCIFYSVWSVLSVVTDVLISIICLKSLNPENHGSNVLELP